MINLDKGLRSRVQRFAQEHLKNLSQDDFDVWRNSPIGEVMFDMYIPMVIESIRDEMSDVDNLRASDNNFDALRWYMLRTMMIQAFRDFREDATFNNICNFFEVDDEEEDNPGGTPDTD